jgi:F1F0 ATPase subunit 2
MTLFVAFTTGFGLGLASFGALWLTVRRLLTRPGGNLGMGVSGLARLLLIGLVFWGLGREGPDKVLAGLAGLWLARGVLLRELGGVRHGR